MVDTTDRRRLRRRPCRAGSRVRQRGDRTRLPVEHRGHRRMGHGLPGADRRGNPARRHQTGGHVLHGVRRGNPLDVPLELRRAHLSGIRYRREVLVRLISGATLAHLPAGACGGPVVLHRSWIRCHHAHALHRHLHLQDRRRTRRCVRRTVATGGQALPRRHQSGAQVGLGHHRLQRTVVHHAQHRPGGRGRGPGGRRHPHPGHDSARPSGNRSLETHEPVGDRQAVPSLPPALLGPLHVQPHRERAQVRHGGHAPLRQPAVLQRAVLPRPRHPARRRVPVQAATAETRQHLVEPSQAPQIRSDRPGNDRRHHAHDRRHARVHGLAGDTDHELHVRCGF